MSSPRQTEIVLTWMNRVIIDDIAPHLVGLSYTDVLAGEADDLAIEVEDRDALWSGPWQPAKGDACEVTIKASPWCTNVEELYTGIFSHDKISLSGPPSRVSLRCVSAPLASGLRRKTHTRAWQSVTLKQIATDIAQSAGLALQYEAAPGAPYKRRDQKNKSNLAFLQELCEKAGQAIKVYDGKIVIFDEIERDAQPATCEINLSGGRVLSWSFDGDTSARYGSCRVSCTNPRSGKKLVGTFTDPTNRDGQTLEVVHHADSLGEAQSMARAMLFNANRFATSGRLSVVGDCGLVAGTNFNLVNARGFDGKFVITKATHYAVGGYRVELDVRRCVEGY